jgi:alpha-beta hydrolase superfamily lysophospholipase
VTWKKIHLALRLAFASTHVVEKVRLKHTRTIAALALPLLVKHAPKLLAIYMNTSSTDTSHAATMVQTVEDPNPHVNLDIAHWLKDRELTVRGVNVSRALEAMTYPHLTVLAKDDGIVPPETARDIYETIGSTDKQILEVGGGDHPMAHADLFLATGAQELIFEPLAQFLLKRKFA